jgi:hypothetical protein
MDRSVCAMIGAWSGPAPQLLVIGAEVARFLLTASGEFEADIIRERLAEAGISVLIEGQGNPRAITAGVRDIYVDDTQLEHAREVLAAAQNVDEDQLDALSQGAAPPSRPASVPLPGRGLWKAVLKRGRRREGEDPFSQC